MSHTNDGAPVRRVVIACQGGASHTAFTAGALRQIFQDYADQFSQHRTTADQYQIIGLSGTSGGTICAFLAWYGLLTGGPQGASRLLDKFWYEGIAAKPFGAEWVMQQGGLAMLNSPWGPIAQTMAELMGVPYKFNPQDVMDRWAALHVGPLGDFFAPRPEFVNMEKLFKKRDSQGEPLIDETLLAHIGEAQRKLQQISQIISELNVLPDQAKNIHERLDKIKSLADEIDLEPFALEFRNSVRDQLSKIKHYEAHDLIDGKEKGYVQPLPTLLLGAVDVLSGAFKAFDSRKGEISLDSVLASTILPQMFKARTIGNQEYWDGLYSENPPVRGFVELPDEPDEKPDEIWLVKIDPPERPSAPEDPDAIEDRRNQLSGDLSLNQELCAIESINQWLGKFNAASRRKYKHVTILRMQLDAPRGIAGVQLDVKSKMYRGGEFIRALMEHGGEQARAFLPIARQKARLRRLVEVGWNYLVDDTKRTRQDVRLAEILDANHKLASFSEATPAPRESAPGPEGVQEFIRKLKADCLREVLGKQAPASGQTRVASSLYFTIDDLIVGWDEATRSKELLAACRWTLRGSRSDPPPQSVKIQGTWVSRLMGDKIMESWVWDTRNLRPVPRDIVLPDHDDRKSKQKAQVIVRHWLKEGSVNRHVSLVRNWLEEGWVNRHVSLVDECFATSYIHNDCAYFPEICGGFEYTEWLKENLLDGSAPRGDREIVHLFGEGDRVVALLRWAGDQLGVVIYRVAGGEIQESWWTWDTQRLCRSKLESDASRAQKRFKERSEAVATSTQG
jgi:predicted acylesterase/phospholipase RssA